MYLQSLKPVLKRTLVVLCIAHTAHTPLWGWHPHNKKLHQQKMSKADRKRRAEQIAQAKRMAIEIDKEWQRGRQERNKKWKRDRQQAVQALAKEERQRRRQLAAQKGARMLHW